MSKQSYRYLIVGGGLAGANAIKGIRSLDTENPILLIAHEPHRPYDRPPLTKQLWWGKKQVEQIFIGKETFYADNGIDLLLQTTVTALDTAAKTVRDDSARSYMYDTLLLATGGVPRRLEIPGGDLDGIVYYRYLADYETLRPQVREGTTVTIIGGGFIGSELAASLQGAGARVTMLYPNAYLVARVFPESLGRALQERYRAKGITIIDGDAPVSIERSGATWVTRTKNGQAIGSDLLVVGAGIHPDTTLAAQAGLRVENGIVVDERLQTSHPDVFAAGDVANFPYLALDTHIRVEHWDHAVSHGKQAGRNMAGAGEAYTHMPYFYSDLFEFGYEAVGEVDARLDTYADWQQEFETGVIYYLREGTVRGVMCCNVWNKLDAARDLIRRDGKVTPEELKGAIG